MIDPLTFLALNGAKIGWYTRFVELGGASMLFF
jgi:hypothetical protein